MRGMEGRGEDTAMGCDCFHPVVMGCRDGIARLPLGIETFYSLRFVVTITSDLECSRYGLVGEEKGGVVLG